MTDTMKTLKYSIAALFALALASCNLDTPPYSEIPEDDFFKTPEEVNQGVLGCYSRLHGVMYYEWAVTELRTDNTRMYATGSTTNTSRLVEQLDQATILTTNDWVNTYWEASYQAILSCNKVLKNLSVVTNPAQRAQYEAEAKFLRAMLHFNLVRLWGPVFKMDEYIPAPLARKKQRSNVDDVYEMIETDLEDIVNNGSLPASYSSSDLGRATSVAAKALLAKVYMTHYEVGQDLYLAAEGLLSQVLTAVGNPQSSADLVPYARIFDVTNEMNDEIIFAVRYKTGGSGLGSPFGSMFAPASSGASVIVGQGSSWNWPSDNILAAFRSEEGDTRLALSLKESYVNVISGTTVNARYITKFLSQTSLKFDCENDWPIIRTGDVVLLYAELLNELYGPANAYKYINMTRQRAGLPALTSTEAPDQITFRAAVRKERRLELAFENQRWADLLRWGVASQTVSAYMAGESFYGGYSYSVGPINDNQCMLPIPQSVMDINPSVAQNPGY